MFTGIIECLGKVIEIKKEQSNFQFHIQSPISNQLKIDQSVAHNGVCLTVVQVNDNVHVVTAIDETIQKTNLSSWQVNDDINLERCMIVNSRLDGHIVQGHVDTVATCSNIEDKNGSWHFTFKLNDNKANYNLIVDKGSICINGTSLTLVNCKDSAFTVAIIPYTYEHTNFKKLLVGSIVNIEFDIVGKYVQKMMSAKVEETNK